MKSLSPLCAWLDRLHAQSHRVANCMSHIAVLQRKRRRSALLKVRPTVQKPKARHCLKRKPPETLGYDDSWLENHVRLL